MSDAEPSSDPDPGDDADGAGPVFSGYGLASAVLAVVAVTAIALGVLVWSGHRREQTERQYESEVLAVAADWVDLLANIDTDNVATTMQALHDGTVGPLNAEFESVMAPYLAVVRQLKSRSTGRIDAVALESLHHDPAEQSGRPPRPTLPPDLASRTDTALVVATSVADNAAGEQAPVRWTLRLDVSDVDGTPMISGLEFLR
ncbi:hypothetical protein H7J07_10710 [Mycobacterium koreense]|uniref:Uncharacterized protein n=1 Tax=Mycolicibacillus koreensis TaxID=1069220 RepID=A0A7I7SI23_9MYCO|nr:hypothetical protein [Mycolicibacillus koreensis]MCV7248683.1 hypothetical protein [Mycolicibacillus koreensis]OSC31156.1 hypothetical protein B8W67_16520 [Mycolicibacillus koreensis]BBY55645.1 hypothetical protein MKOR_28960 [Mycolicibacillus koreensis]